MSKYKVIELARVTDEDLEDALNEWDEKGYILENCLFAMRESSKRPSMAFLVFTARDDKEEKKDSAPTTKEK
ncbi:MAG: hypothetical protein Kow0090_18640 [Myxococcota bacterium]